MDKEKNKKINNHKDNINNINKNKEGNENVNKNHEQKNENFKINYRVNSNLNQAANNDGISAIRVNDNKDYDINRNIGFNAGAHNEINEPSFCQKFNNLIDNIRKNNDISLNIIREIKKSDENTKIYVHKMTNIMSTQTLDLINEMKNSNKNTQSLIEKYDELLEILLKQKKWTAIIQWK